MPTQQDEFTKPIRRVPEIPDPQAHRALRAALKKRGMSDHVAAAVSTIWTNPADVLKQVANPQRRRIPGAELIVISGQVYTARLAPDPHNPRNADRVQFKMAEAAGAPPIALVPARTAGVGEISIEVESREALTEQLEWSIETTRARNHPKPAIDKQGIMDSPIGVATTVHYANGQGPTTHVFAREGSSRLAHALYHLDVDVRDVLFELPRSAAPMQAHIAQLNKLANMAADEIQPSDEAALRCAVTDFELIIGVEPDTTDAVDLAQAIKARVAQDHLNTKMEWTNPAKDTALAEECLSSALSAGVIPTHAEALWLGGHLTVAQAETAELVSIRDDRAARILYLFTTTDPKIHQAIRKPIAFVLTEEKPGQRKNVTGRTKLPLAVELVVRERRGAVADTKLAEFRKVLTDALPADLAKRKWKASTASPDALVQATAKEVGAGELGESATELWVRSAYVLAKHGCISGGRHDRGPSGDRRTPADLIEDLLNSEIGRLNLRQTLDDDRAGIAPRQVDWDGTLRTNSLGEHMTIDNEFLRTKVVPQDDDTDDTDKDPDPTQGRLQKYQAALKETKATLRQLERAIENLGGAEDENGLAYITEQGRPHARLLYQKLKELSEIVLGWREEDGPEPGPGDESF